MHNKGFTLIESLVSIGILVAVVIGAMGAVQTGISSYTFSKNQVVAFYLAQEGIEQIRNVRDQNGLLGNHWLAGIASNSSDPCYFGKICRVDTLNSSITTCSGSCSALRQDPSTGFYGYDSSWSTTPFVREVSLTSINSNEVAILVKVSWSKGTVSREFRARENILNWQ